MEPLKDIYTNKNILKQVAVGMKVAYSKLDKDAFSRALLKDLNTLELKARIERVADVCFQFLPKDYPKALDVLYKFVDGKESQLIYIFLPTFVAKYGQHDYPRSIKAIRDFTQYCSSEEGVRTFLELDLTTTLQTMLQWTRSKNVHIRRLASEGCRPRLPWAKKVPILIEQPELTWPILDSLREDPEKYVQKSVANHINDISKDHPDWIVGKVKQWDLSHPITGWIIKHGMRTLIKEGHKGALKLFGFHKTPKVALEGVEWDKRVSLGQRWSFSLDFVCKDSNKQDYLVDYRIYFIKKNGQQSAKTFKLKKVSLSKGERVEIRGHYVFKDMTTRKHYPGKHAWQLLVNGVAMKKNDFDVK